MDRQPTAASISPDPGSRPRLLQGLILAGLFALPLGLQVPAGAESGMGAIVKAFCLSAFESEMAQAGKTPPQGMANFACDCVAERLRNGGGLDSARRDCRELTARRYPI